MNRVIIIGPGGAGKSTFSRKLAEITKLPLYNLDNIYWKENKEHITREEFNEKLEEILKKDKWIIDGDYGRTYEIRIKFADTIYFLDYSLETCLNGVSSRIGTKREDCPFIETEFDEEFREWIINWPKNKRPIVIDLLEKYNDKNIIIFKNRKESEEYLNAL